MIKKIFKLDLILSSIFINIFSLALPIYVIQALTRYLNHGISETLYILTIGTILAIILELLLRNYRRVALKEEQVNDDSKTTAYFKNLSKINFEDKNLKIVTDLPQKLKKYRIQSSTNEINLLTNALDSPFIIIHLVIIFLLSKSVFFLFILFLLLGFILKSISDKNLATQKLSVTTSRNKNTYFEKDFIKNFQTLSLYTNIKTYLKKIQNEEVKILKDQKNYFSLIQKFEFNTIFLRSLLSIFIIFIACISIYEGQMEIGVLIALNIIIAKTFFSFINFFDLLNTIKDTELVRSFDTLSRTYPKRDGNIILEKSSGSIRLRKIYLQYTENKIPIFEDLSIEFKSGSTNVITGNNGVGKSTLFRLITGLQQPDQGEIFIDDINIQQINQEIYVKQFISIPQEPEFFEGSIKENFLLLNEDITIQNIIDSINESGLGKFIGETEKGIDTFIDYKGTIFSLGMKKRLALARAILMNGSIVIFDEPTEGLDDEGASLFYNYLNKVNKLNKTIIIFSNDRKIVKGAKNIINLNQFSKPSILSRSEITKEKNE